MQTENILHKLKSEGLKITPQRVIILKAVYSLNKKLIEKEFKQ